VYLPPRARAHAVLLGGREVDEERAFVGAPRAAGIGLAPPRYLVSSLEQRRRLGAAVELLARVDGGEDGGVVCEGGALLWNHANLAIVWAIGLDICMYIYIYIYVYINKYI